MPKKSVANRSAAVDSKKCLLTRPSTSRRSQQRAGRLIAEAGLQIRHQQRRRNTFARDVGQDETERVIGDFEEVVVVAADLSRRQALPGIVDRAHRAQIAREELLLDVGRDLQLGPLAPLRLGLFADRGHQAVVVPGLLDEVAGAAAHRFDRDIEAAPRGHHHHRRAVALLFEAGEQVHAFGAGGGVAGVVEVHEDQIEDLRRGSCASALRGESTATACQPSPFEQEAQGLEDVGLIVAHQHAVGFDLGHVHSRSQHLRAFRAVLAPR